MGAPNGAPRAEFGVGNAQIRHTGGQNVGGASTGFADLLLFKTLLRRAIRRALSLDSPFRAYGKGLIASWIPDTPR